MSRVASVVATAAALAGFALAPMTGRAESDYRDLKTIAFFGSISATVHVAGPDDTAKGGLSSVQLTQRAEARFVGAFPDIPYRRIDPANWGAPENVNAMGKLSCRAWIDATLATAAYQIKCQISTTARPNIVEDGSMGYAPKERIVDVVIQQFDRILAGFGTVFRAVRNDQ
jgi:hypothetical protein